MKSLSQRIVRKLSAYRKEASKILFHIGKKHESQIVFLMGCQRSGTSLTSNIFNEDKNIKVFKEMRGILTSQDSTHGIRLNDLDTLKKTWKKYNFPTLLAKPLVESQNAHVYLENIPNLLVIWLFRNYIDVAASNIKHFGDRNGHKNLSPIFENAKNNWRNDNLSPTIKDFVDQFNIKDLSSHDAAALFWWARNQLFFDQTLEKHNRVILCKYEDIVMKAEFAFQRLYDFIGVEFLNREPLRVINNKALGRGREISINPKIRAACDTLYEKLDLLYESSIHT